MMKAEKLKQIGYTPEGVEKIVSSYRSNGRYKFAGAYLKEMLDSIHPLNNNNDESKKKSN